MTTERPYHHGDLRRAVLAAAVDVITEHGTSGVGLRDLARRVGVSHAGPVHHFRDKAGLLTALAAEGFDLLADALATTRDGGGDFVDVGASYVRFAVENRAHFEVMFRPDLYHPDDPAVAGPRQRAYALLHGGVTDEDDPKPAAVAAWSIVHGFATLWNTGALPRDPSDDPQALGRSVAAFLFRDNGKGG
ncbi:TetR/AcrR family transcriptional regulator [Actinosynnema sp. NPDC047251]|uniref:Transcriptional regulator, TetR family n=1 Tax=Saccharothrix espanaensis (strain ATCC 51144 / DSM 44229 / JCM 9112 / NBRC 15066 / NRRL 15764) TaxID=1179773 RepID=K0JZN1_SACES|nr:TetR/AcrR family transcriptional regulator [Saccharothrix espanaensis]CCH30757.1 Transcriptional regulator, TetR family [Saccharothrix espanaensis DSM 44229]